MTAGTDRYQAACLIQSLKVCSCHGCTVLWPGPLAACSYTAYFCRAQLTHNHRPRPGDQILTCYGHAAMALAANCSDKPGHAPEDVSWQRSMDWQYINRSDAHRLAELQTVLYPQTGRASTGFIPTDRQSLKRPDAYSS